MSNSMIFGGHLENMQIRSLRRHFSTCQHWFSDSAYQMCQTLFFTKCLYLLTFLIFFPDCKKLFPIAVGDKILFVLLYDSPDCINLYVFLKTSLNLPTFGVAASVNITFFG